MSKKLVKEVPENYALCLHEDCPCASICLRRLACKPMMERFTYLCALNPDSCVPETSCFLLPKFCSSDLCPWVQSDAEPDASGTISEIPRTSFRSIKL